MVFFRCRVNRVGGIGDGAVELVRKNTNFLEVRLRRPTFTMQHLCTLALAVALLLCAFPAEAAFYGDLRVKRRSAARAADSHRPARNEYTGSKATFEAAYQLAKTRAPSATALRCTPAMLRPLDALPLQRAFRTAEDVPVLLHAADMHARCGDADAARKYFLRILAIDDELGGALRAARHWQPALRTAIERLAVVSGDAVDAEALAACGALLPAASAVCAAATARAAAREHNIVRVRELVEGAHAALWRALSTETDPGPRVAADKLAAALAGSVCALVANCSARSGTQITELDVASPTGSAADLKASVRRLVELGVPFVLRGGAANWSVLRRWTNWTHLAQDFGDEVVTVRASRSGVQDMLERSKVPFTAERVAEQKQVSGQGDPVHNSVDVKLRDFIEHLSEITPSGGSDGEDETCVETDNSIACHGLTDEDADPP